MHPSHAVNAVRELQRQELLAYAEQQRLVDLACAGTRPARPGAALIIAMQAYLHRVTALIPQVWRERPSTSPAPADTETSSPLIAHRS